MNRYDHVIWISKAYLFWGWIALATAIHLPMTRGMRPADSFVMGFGSAFVAAGAIFAVFWVLSWFGLEFGSMD